MKIYDILKEQNSNSKDGIDEKLSSDARQELEDYVFWSLLDHDHLHKKHALPIAHEMTELRAEDKLERDKFVDCWMPMVKEGCMAYYKENKMEGDPKDLFPKEMRKSLCHRLADQYYNDVLNDEYQMG